MRTLLSIACGLVLGFGATDLSAFAADVELPRRIRVDENDLLLGGLPATPELKPSTAAALTGFFSELVAEKIEYRYIVGSCEDRTHYITLMLKKRGIDAGKVWVIAPARYTLLSRELITLKDPYGVVDKVSWGHHVAPIVRVKDGSGPEKLLVIDQSLSPAVPLELNEWLRKLNSPASLYFLTSESDYLFKSLDGLKVYNNTQLAGPGSMDMPNWMTNILTGDFMKYSFELKGQEVANGMATNDAAMAIFKKQQSAGDTAEKRALLNALAKESELNSLLTAGTHPGVSSVTIQEIQAQYKARLAHWKERLRQLSGAPGALTTDQPGLTP